MPRARSSASRATGPARQQELFPTAAEVARRKAERKLAHFIEMATAIDELFQAALATEGPRVFNDYLDSICRLRHLSAFNAMLVRAQRPGVSYVATRAQWRRRGRHVLPDAIPIVILQPFGPVLFLYEVTDTDGPDPVDEVEGTFRAFGDVTEPQWNGACKRALEHRVRVVLTPFGTRLAGTARGMRPIPRLAPEKQTDWLVRLNSRFDLPTRLATLFHELGHIYCGHCGQDGMGRWPMRRPDSYAVRELEAEAVAWLVCRRMGITTRSQEYLSDLATEENIREVGRDLGLFSIVRAVEYIEWDSALRSA